MPRFSSRWQVGRVGIQHLDPVIVPKMLSQVVAQLRIQLEKH